MHIDYFLYAYYIIYFIIYINYFNSSLYLTISGIFFDFPPVFCYKIGKFIVIFININTADTVKIFAAVNKETTSTCPICLFCTLLYRETDVLITFLQFPLLRTDFFKTGQCT